MSAYLCEPHHIAALATYPLQASGETHYIVTGKSAAGFPQIRRLDDYEVAELLARANLASLRARYSEDSAGEHSVGSDGAAWALGGQSDEEYVKACQAAITPREVYGPSLSPVEAIKAAQCYDYQACEVSEYDETDAARATRKIIAVAIARLPGYEAAPWGAPETRSVPTRRTA